MRHRSLYISLIGELGLAVLFGVVAFLWLNRGSVTSDSNFGPAPEASLFPVQSIDTMKFSRDMAPEALSNLGSYKPLIDRQMALIAGAGATHVAIDTPYDSEFLPVLRLWVASARAHGLSVFFRGNFSGWEGWFDYPKIDAATHEQDLRTFLANNPSLFKSGDVFTPCTECENGGTGDPRETGDASGYNQMLIAEAKIAEAAFAAQGKHIEVYPAMNADIARQVISPAAISAFDGTILIDHYVSSVQEFASDVSTIPAELHAAVGLGEFGAPIPDLNGAMTQAEQASYIDGLMGALYRSRATVPLVNYWDLMGGSTALVNDTGTPRLAYAIVRDYFKAYNAYGMVYDSLGSPISGAEITVNGASYQATSTDGAYELFVPRQYDSITIRAAGYTSATILMPTSTDAVLAHANAYLNPIAPSWWYALREYISKHF